MNHTTLSRLVLCLAACLLSARGAACTNFLVGKKASTDGSTYITYNADDYGMFGHLVYLPHATHKAGATRRIVDGDTHHYLGDIPEVAETYAVVGYMNEHQLSIMETTFGGRPELVDTLGKIDYVSLMRLALQRAKTAREAINVMTSLVEQYGYASEGESFSIADKEEVWIMEMIGKGSDVRGANWVAVRIPDDAIAAHANQSRIHTFSQYDKADVLHSKDLIDFARRHGYFTGKDADFDFSAAFAPADFSAIRYCEARVWSFFNRFVPGMDKYLAYADGLHIGQDGVEPMPLYMRPSRPLSRQDVFAAMRDHYEGTPFDVLSDCGMGPGEMPYRPTPLEFEYNGKKYFNERPTSTQQTADTYVAQIRGWLTDGVGGILWYGQDDPNMISYVPIYCHTTQMPRCFDTPGVDGVTFSRENAFWLCNWVSNMTYPRYNQLFPVLRQTRDALDSTFTARQAEAEAILAAAFQTSEAAGAAASNQYASRCAAEMMQAWTVLSERLIVQFNDMAVRPRDAHGYLMTPDGLPVRVKRPGYPESYRRKIIEETGTRFLVPGQAKE